jgi:hypothetical protein
MSKTGKYSNFAEFYPFYLHQHSHAVCRALHYIGTSAGLAFLVYAIVSGRYWFIVAGIVVGYALAWVGHFFFEKNKPATFEYPAYSFCADWVMLKDFLTGRLSSIHPDLTGARSDEQET